MQVFIGMMLYGNCGFSDIDYWAELRIESFGADWIVARDCRARPVFIEFDSYMELIGCLEKWTKRPEEWKEED